jgi:hypothetical protein
MNIFTKALTVISVAFCVLISPSNAVAADLPDPGVKFVKGHVAIVITDPQVDFLSPKGVTWHLVGKNVTENNTVENIDRFELVAELDDLDELDEELDDERDELDDRLDELDEELDDERDELDD